MSNAPGQEPVTKKHVVIVGGGFAGLNCARKLASHSDVRITLIDKNNYQQFQPLIYQVGLAKSPTTGLNVLKMRCRDYAILLLLARLGLRPGGVVSLELDDIDWNVGELSVRGKRGQRSELPLPAEVGQAIAAYLRRGFPEPRIC
jgi:integrase